MRRFSKLFAALTAMLLMAMLVVVGSPFASAADGTLTLTGGSLTLATVADFSYPSTQLTGASFNLTSSFVADVTDATGSAAGWNLTAQIGTMTATGGKTIAAAGHTITGVTRTAGTGTAPTNSTTYAMQIPTSTAKIYSANANTGMGQSTLSFATQLTVPAATLVGDYTATLTVSLVSGP
jgi:hypothetical protein